MMIMYGCEDRLTPAGRPNEEMRSPIAVRGIPIPRKLKHDAIVEALCEIRFDMASIPEVFFGRLADYRPWQGFRQQRTPVYSIPDLMRQADPNLRYQPLFEFVEPNGSRAVRIGQQVLSYHRMAPYVGWSRFRSELGESIDALFTRADGLVIRRLGLRYINALRKDLHSIGSIADLDLDVIIAGERLTGHVNVNFTIPLADDTQCTMRVSTIEFVQGTLPPSTSVVVDVDVSTKDGFQTDNIDTVKTWIEAAHTWEKEMFFRLLTEQTIEGLRED